MSVLVLLEINVKPENADDLSNFRPRRPFKQAMYEQGIAAAAFEVADVQLTYERLRGRGVEFFTDPTATIAVFHDTCGNYIQIYQPPQ